MKLKLLGILFLSFNLQFACGSFVNPTKTELAKLKEDLAKFRELGLVLDYRSPYPHKYKNDFISVDYNYEDDFTSVTDLDKIPALVKVAQDSDVIGRLFSKPYINKKILIILTKNNIGVVTHINLNCTARYSSQDFSRNYFC